jgi:hypothetical protein
VFSTFGTTVDALNVVNRHFKPLLKCAGLRDIRWHDLRRTCATLLLGRRVHSKLAQHLLQLLGHASIIITLDRYSQWIATMGRHAANGMDEALAWSLLLTKLKTPTSGAPRFAEFAGKTESRRANSNHFLLITADKSRVAGLCTGLQIPHNETNLFSPVCPVLHRIAFRLVLELRQNSPTGRTHPRESA